MEVAFSLINSFIHSLYINIVLKDGSHQVIDLGKNLMPDLQDSLTWENIWQRVLV